MHSISVFASAFNDIEIIVALPKEYFRDWENLCIAYKFNIKHTIAEGGETRFDSVKNCLAKIQSGDEAIIGIHDAARPLVTVKTITELFKAAEESGNAIPVIIVSDSVREIDKKISKPIDRHKLCLVQTPQCFHSAIIKKAYQQDFKAWFTDDATVAEALGEKINLIDGDPTNLKITTPTDFLIAETLCLRSPS
jgi:2-C-methyl-D-erythritol 4-phosphate cytidylyltransferase